MKKHNSKTMVSFKGLALPGHSTFLIKGGGDEPGTGAEKKAKPQ